MVLEEAFAAPFGTWPVFAASVLLKYLVHESSAECGCAWTGKGRAGSTSGSGGARRFWPQFRTILIKSGWRKNTWHVLQV